MIKRVFKSLLTFGIIGLGIINFSNASSTQTFYLNTPAYVLDASNGAYTFELLDYGNFKTDGLYNYFFWRDSSYGTPLYFNVFWAHDGLYMLMHRGSSDVNTPTEQGYLINLCQANTYQNYSGPCSVISTGEFYTSTYSKPDSLYMVFGQNSQMFKMCFNYSLSEKTVCVEYFYRPSTSYNYITGSLNIGYMPSTPSEYTNNSFQSYVRYSKWGGGGGGNGGGIIINTGSNASNNGSFVNVECNNGNIKRFYEEAGYSKYLCYGGESYWSAGNYSTQMLIPGTGYSIFDIYNYMSGAIGTGDTYSTGNSIDVWFQYWRSQYGWWTNQYVSTENPFVGNPRILFGLFNFISRYGPTFQDKYVLDYCNLLINSDLSADYDGPNAKIFHCNSQGIVDFTNVDGTGGNSNNIGGLTSSWSGTFLGVGSGSLGSGQVYNFSSFMTNFFDIISKVFNGLVGFESRVGFLPRYIVVPMLFLVLFRFLSH